MTEPVPTPVSAAAEPTPEDKFSCVKCGIELEAHTNECPICGEKYLDLPKDALDQLEKAEAEEDSASLAVGEESEDKPQCVVFDAEEGVIDFIQKDSKAFEVALICSECGTALEFATDSCPICGADMDTPDAGLVGLVSEMTFEGDASEEMVCPNCGEEVTLEKGKCPQCGESIIRADPGGKTKKLNPVVRGENVVFLHLDVEAGELSYLQRGLKKEGFEKMTVRLEGT